MRKLLLCLSLGAASIVSLQAGGPPSEAKIEKQERKYSKQQEKLYARDRKASEKMARRSARLHERKDKQHSNTPSNRYPPQ